MAVVVGLVGAADAIDVATWHGIPATPTSRLSAAFLPAPDPAFEQDDRALAVDDLRDLQARKPLLQRRQRSAIVAGERVPPFKFR